MQESGHKLFAMAPRKIDAGHCSAVLLKLQQHWREHIQKRSGVTLFRRAKKNALA